MVNGYIKDNSNNWVSSATLYRNSPNAIRMATAPVGSQFLQWEVYVNGVLQTDSDEIEIPTAEQTRLKKLVRDITIKATYYIPDENVRYTLSIERKDGSVEQNTYTVGTEVTIIASLPNQGYEFYKWIGDVAYVAGGTYNSTSYINMPAQNIYIKENYVLEGYIPEYDLEMKNIYGECCYTTEYEDPQTGEITTTDHWVSRWSYPEGTVVRIRATGYEDDRYFSEWNATNHDTGLDARSIIADITSSTTTLMIPTYDVDATPIIPLKDTYLLTITNGGTSGTYYEGAKADVYFNKSEDNTNDVHYEFIRWVGGTGTNIADIELWDGGMFNVLTPGTSSTPQYIKMPGKATEIIANYRTLYKLALTNGTIDSTSTTSGYYETGITVNITADTPATGLMFQYWSGDTSRVANIYDPTTTVTTTGGVTNLTAVYSTINDRNNIGYTNTDLKSTSVISNNSITVISGTIGVGFIITDVNGHIYIVTAVDTQNNTSTIYRMTKIVRGGNIYE